MFSCRSIASAVGAREAVSYRSPAILTLQQALIPSNQDGIAVCFVIVVRSQFDSQASRLAMARFSPLSRQFFKDRLGGFSCWNPPVAAIPGLSFSIPDTVLAPALASAWAQTL